MRFHAITGATGLKEKFWAGIRNIVSLPLSAGSFGGDFFSFGLFSVFLRLFRLARAFFFQLSVATAFYSCADTPLSRS
jgi:hypothetical protein